MSVRLILARHGNTFKPEEEPVWVGARSDLPLVDKGLVQAQALAAALQKTNARPDVLFAGPLKRTQQTASIVAEALNLPADTIRTDARLREIDYGTWEGKSTAAIIAAGDDEELHAWNKHSIYPTNPGWRPSEAQMIADIGALLMEIKEGTALIITSNGILRFFARAAFNAGDFPDRKVATGNLCLMEGIKNGEWLIVNWNIPPDRLSF